MPHPQPAQPVTTIIGADLNAVAFVASLSESRRVLTHGEVIRLRQSLAKQGVKWIDTVEPTISAMVPAQRASAKA